MSTNRYLVFSSIGENSIHDMWLNVENRLFDITLVYYADNDDQYSKLEELSSDTIFVHRRKGFKWPNFNWYIENMDVSQYKYIWIVDDDIQIRGDRINEFFKTAESYPNIQICGPSTTNDSVNTLGGPRNLDRHNCKLLIEYKNLIECGLIMINTALLQNDFFRKILRTTNTGYYFDLLVKYCFTEEEKQTSIAVLHNIVARHGKRNGPSEMGKKLPISQHPNDIYAFLKAGIPNHMMIYSIVRYSVVENKEAFKCNACDLSLLKNS
jgi:hypothetical protein